MICTNCNNEIDNDSNFCKYCGTKVVKANVCPKCGAENLPKDARFCPDCGCKIQGISIEISLHSFVKEKILPFWPAPNAGALLSNENIQHLKDALDKISTNISHDNLRETDKQRCKFVEQAIKSILDITGGYKPHYDVIIRENPAYTIFWENLKKECGENNYNPYWHYNSGIFADRLIKKIQNL